MHKLLRQLFWTPQTCSQSAGDAGKDYKAKYRSLIFNLRDAANPDLRARVLKGELPPDKLVQLSAEGLASKVWHPGPSAWSLDC